MDAARDSDAFLDHDEAAARILWWSSGDGIWTTKCDDDGTWRRVNMAACDEIVTENNGTAWWPWHTLHDATEAPYHRWFVGGRTNACFNAVDRHLLENRGETVAFTAISEASSQDPISITRQQLAMAVATCARELHDVHGLRAMGRVFFHMPTSIDQMVWMLACQRNGIVYTATAVDSTDGILRDRVQDFQPHVVMVLRGICQQGGETVDCGARMSRHQGEG